MPLTAAPDYMNDIEQTVWKKQIMKLLNDIKERTHMCGWHTHDHTAVAS